MRHRKQRYVVTVNGQIVGSIFRRGRWYHFDYRPALVTREQVGLNTDDMKQAIPNAERHAQGAPPLPQAPTLQERQHSKTLTDVFKLYKTYYGPDKKRLIEEGETPRRRPSTNRRFYPTIASFIKFHGETRPTCSITRQHIEAFIEHQRTRPNL